MKCPDDQMLEAFADGEFDDALRAEIECHVDGCEACRERFQAVKRADATTRRALAALKASAPPMTLAPVKAKARLLDRPFAIAAAAAMVLAVAAGGIWLFIHLGATQRRKASPQAVAMHMPPEQTRQVAMETEAFLPVPILTEEAIAAMRDLSASDPEECSRRLASLRRAGRATAATMPDWRIERLRRLLLYTRGILPVDNG